MRKKETLGWSDEGAISSVGDLAPDAPSPAPAPARFGQRPLRWLLAGVAGLIVLVGGTLGVLAWPSHRDVESAWVSPSALPVADAAPSRIEASALDPAGLAVARPLAVATLTSAAGEEGGPAIPGPADGAPRSDSSESASAPSQPVLPESLVEREEMERRLALQDERIRLMTAALRESRERMEPLETELASLGAELTTASRRIQALDARLSEQAAATERKAASEPPPTKPPPPPPALPFRVLSIDLWGERLQVTVEHQEGTHFLGVGDSRGGWTVDAIDRAEGTVVFRTRGGAKRAVRVAG